MAGNATTTNADGDLVQITVTEPTATISFGRKNGLPGYSNEEMSIFLQVPLAEIYGETIDDKMKALEQALDPHAAFVKAFVYKQLGTTYGVDDGNGVVTALDSAASETPKATTARTTRGSTAKGNGPGDKDDLWRRLANAAPNGKNFKTQDGETVWDNREGKKNPKAPDYKFADSGFGLWNDKAPEWFQGPCTSEAI